MYLAHLICKLLENCSVFGAFAKLPLPNMTHLVLHRLDHAGDSAANDTANADQVVSIDPAPFPTCVLLSRYVENHIVPVRQSPSVERSHVPQHFILRSKLFYGPN